MKGKWDYLIIGILGGLLGAGILILMGSPPIGEPITLIPAGTRAPLMVAVDGAVKQAGVYSFSAGARIADAIEAANGLLPNANIDRLNMAAFLEDGMRVHVPLITTPQPTSEGGANAGTNAETPQFPINLNTANLEQLQFLPGIGPVKAQGILEYREANGYFESIEEILNVTGIGPATFDVIKELITVDEF